MQTRWILTVMVLFATAGPAAAADPSWNWFGLGEAMKDDVLHAPTLGGRVFWGDVGNFRGWRIQKNVIDEHYRLLDPEDRRYASGTLAECEETLDRIKQQRGLAPLSGKAAILIHGMGRSSKSWPKLARRLEEDGYLVVSFDYPSTRCAITESAGYLSQVIDSLEGIEQIDFVCHSMGGLVVRAYLVDHDDDRIGRMVMLGVPNRGAEMADKVGSWPLYQIICGPGGCQLGTDPDGLIASLPTPEFEFAVVAGARGTEGGYNPFIPGDDDGTVTVTSTRLPGATDSIEIEGAMHSFLMFDRRVIDATARFLATGKLREKGEAEPVPRETDETVEQVGGERQSAAAGM